MSAAGGNHMDWCASVKQRNRAELNAIVEAWTRQRGKHEVMRLMGMRAFPAAPARTPGRSASQGARDYRRRGLPDPRHLSDGRPPSAARADID